MYLRVHGSQEAITEKSDFVEPLQAHDHTCLLSSSLMIAPPPQMITITIDHIDVYNAWHNINGNKSETSKPLLREICFWSSHYLSFLDVVIKVGISCMAISEP